MWRVMELRGAGRHWRKGLDLDELVGSGDAAFCKTVGATLEEYKEWLQEWPYSEQARAVSWLEPKESSSSGGPRSQRRNFQNRRFEKKGRFSKGRGPRRDAPNQSRNAGTKGRFQKADDWAERFSRAELYQEMRLRLLHALLQSDFNGRQYDSDFCEKAIARIADQRRLSHQVRVISRAVASVTGGHAGRTAALRKHLAIMQERRDRRLAEQARRSSLPEEVGSVDEEASVVRADTNQSAAGSERPDLGLCHWRNPSEKRNRWSFLQKFRLLTFKCRLHPAQPEKGYLLAVWVVPLVPQPTSEGMGPKTFKERSTR
eukprot:symbB.v1.2.000316.t1/scaffold6.1/size569917/19